MPLIPALPASAYQKFADTGGLPSQAPKPVYVPPKPLPSPNSTPIPQQLQPLRKPAPPQLPFADPPPKLPKLSPSVSTPTTNPMSLPSGAVPGAAVGSGGVAVGMLQLGLVVVAAGLMMHNAQQLMKLWQLSQPEPEFEPFYPTTQEDVEYEVAYDAWVSAWGRPDFVTTTTSAIGKIGSFRVHTELDSNGAPIGTGCQLYCKQTGFGALQGEPKEYMWHSLPTGASGNTEVQGKNFRILRKVGETDEVFPPPQPQPKRQPIQAVNTPPELLDYPEKPKLQIIPNIAPTPHAQPQPLVQPTDRPFEPNKRTPTRITAPAGQRITVTTPGGQPVIIPGGTPPKTITIDRNDPTIKIGENPVKTPTAPTQTPAAPPIELKMPSGQPITIDIPGQEPITFDPTTRNLPQGVQAAPIQQDQPRSFTPIPLIKPAVPTPTPTPTPSRPTTPTPQTPTTPQLPTIDQPDLIDIGTGLAAITALLQQINTNTSPSAIQKATETANCKTAEPAGCTGKQFEDIKKKQDQTNNKLDNLDKAVNAADTAIDADTNLRVRNIQDKIGAAKYPMILPEYLLDEHLDKPIVINDQVDYQVWALKQWDALIGLFPIKIERTDENGNKQMLKFENIAEAIAEITGLLAEIAFDADTSVNVGVHATAEAIGAKVAAVQASSQLKSIIDYLGFQGSHKAISVPISCTPGATGLDGKLQESELKDFLKSSTQRAIGWQCTERDDLHSIIKRILFDSEVARAALYKPLKPPTSAGTSMTGDAIKADIVKEKQRENDEWERFKTRIKNQEGTGVDVDLEEKSLTDEGTP